MGDAGLKIPRRKRMRMRSLIPVQKAGSMLKM